MHCTVVTVTVLFLKLGFTVQSERKKNLLYSTVHYIKLQNLIHSLGLVAEYLELTIYRNIIHLRTYHKAHRIENATQRRFFVECWLVVLDLKFKDKYLIYLVKKRDKNFQKGLTYFFS